MKNKYKTLLLGINSKYIHPNLAIRLLKANTEYETDIKEFIIKDDLNLIYNYIIDNNYQVVAISCYIWNIEIIKELLNMLKDKNLIIILGGPEVSYNASYYLENKLCNYVIKNEGEETFDLLLTYLNKNLNDLSSIPNLYFDNKFTFDKLVDISKSKMAYDLLDDLNNKIVYIETSRGCPYHCAYCMASLDNKVRFFEIEEIKRQLLLLNERGARVIKFLDRTFNANKKNFISLIDFIILNHKEGQSYQFEITGDILDPDIIDYINLKAPKNLFRFEIGIQSTNIKSNLAVNRIQNNEKLFNNIIKIQDANIIDLHLDLIAGLPYEDYNSFKNTFNDVIKLKPKELQLGFLKLLYGTTLFKEAIKYNYIWNQTAPYEIIKNDFLSEDDIKKVHIAEEGLEHLYNSSFMQNTLKYLVDIVDNPYDLFYDLGSIYKKEYKLEDLFKIVNNYFKTFDNYNEIHKLLIIDYLNYFNLKPHAWWDEKLDKKERNNVLRYLKDNNNIDISINDLYKYSLLISLDKTYILAVYMPNFKQILIIEK